MILLWSRHGYKHSSGPYKSRVVCLATGFLELGETGEEGAAREAREEMNADVDVGGLLAVYSLPHIGQM